ncbi:MAG: ABC transporter permease subunit [Pseudonocardiaceae bacterium]|nr:ABC transporter permease subunit [Pseudonocardiaceae bacterium]
MSQALQHQTGDGVPAAPAPVAGRDRRGARWRGRVATWVVKLAGVLVTLSALELASRTGALPRQWFPPVTEMYAELAGLVVGLPLWVEVGRTLGGWAAGLLLATVLAVPAGMLLGASALAFRLVRVVIEFLRPVPSVALIPLAVLVLGTGLETKVFLVAFATFWPLLFQTIYGVQDVDPVATDTARSYGLGALARFGEVTLPSAAPYIATGLRIASAIALVLAVTAELVIGAPGLGQAIIVAQSGGAITLMYALIIATGLLGWALNAVFSAAERRLLHWHPAQRREAGL